ncbi:MAG: GNAT family N-acetyltransferase [Elusimicrobia bacterium]|nr:GNAT family N-acetyltransferase [Elusimicrobiota bacterium]
MKSLVLRPAAAADAEAVAALARREFAAGWSCEAYAAESGRADALFLVAEDGGVRGYALARAQDAEARLLDFAAAEDGRGIGRALWAALADAARRAGARTLTLEVSERNGRARAFYARAGARVVGRRPKFYNDGADALLMDVPLL